MLRVIGCIFALLSATLAMPAPGLSQSNPDLQAFFANGLGLSPNQIASIERGQPVAKVMPSRVPAEVFLVGAVYIHATPDAYMAFVRDFDRLRKLPNYLALGVLSNPPRLSDLKDFSFDKDEIKALEKCKPGDCLVQMPATSIEELQRSIDWSASDVDQRVNQQLQASVLQRLLEYQSQGNHALGIYSDKPEQVDVSKEFAYILSYSKALPERLPEFYRYLLDYPNDSPANVEDTFYWARVKFGLKPTLRLVQMIAMKGHPTDAVAYATAEKQLYASHYFETALDLSFCVRASDDPANPGFYLIMAMGSEQAGLTGPKGAIVRNVAVGRSVSSLRDALTTIKNTLEQER